MTTSNVRSNLDRKLREAFREIIDGKTVTRSRHDLVFGGIDVSNVFIEELDRKGFLPVTVAEVDIEPGTRVPAFVIEETAAWFGWIFWEKFSEKHSRKLFGSIVRNAKGDWQIQIPAGSVRKVFCNRSRVFTMDIDWPFELT